MNKIDYQALREAAEKAGEDKWQAKKINGDFFVIRHGSYTRQHGYTSYQPIAEIDCKPVRDFVAKANPATVLALLDERERNQQYIKRRNQENEDIALTVGKLRVELEGKDSKIANLTAERDALREGEMGNSRHSNTRAAADIYFQLVEECEIPAGGSLVEYVDDMREKLEAAEKRIAELEAKLDSADKLQDSAFRHGLQHGFSFGQTDNQAGFEECLSAYGARGKDNG
ncbi:ead/Ea22-like family protein [Escherichia coli]|nr:ead/Ea22-like family protein [Escherichia coli]